MAWTVIGSVQGPPGAGSDAAIDVSLDATAFNGNLDNTTTNVQLFANLFDDFAVTGLDVPLDTASFGGTLDNTVTNVQLLAEAVDALTVAGTGTITSVNGDAGPDVILSAADVGAVDLLAVDAANGVAPLDAASLVPTTNLPVLVFSVNSLSGVVTLDASQIPLD